MELPLGQPTNFASLVFPTGEVPPGDELLPTALVNYLDSLPVVQAELGGTIASNCEPGPAGPYTPAAAPIAMATIATSVGGVYRRTITSTNGIPAAAAANQGPTPTSAPATAPVSQSVYIQPAPISPKGGTIATYGSGSVTANVVSSSPSSGPVVQTANAAVREGDNNAWLRILSLGMCGVFAFFV